MRLLYQAILLMHPPAFRRRFAAEMLWIFDEASQSSGASALLLDGFISLARQWTLRSGSWKLAVALIGAFVQVTFGGLMFAILRHPHATASVPDQAPAPALDMLLWIIVGSVGPVVIMVTVVCLWTRRFSRNRASSRERRVRLAPIARRAAS